MLYIAEAVKNIITKLDGNNHFLKSHKKFVESLNLAKMTFSDDRRQRKFDNDFWEFLFIEKGHGGIVVEIKGISNNCSF